MPWPAGTKDRSARVRVSAKKRDSGTLSACAMRSINSTEGETSPFSMRESMERDIDERSDNSPPDNPAAMRSSRTCSPRRAEGTLRSGSAPWRRRGVNSDAGSWGLWRVGKGEGVSGPTDRRDCDFEGGCHDVSTLVFRTPESVRTFIISLNVASCPFGIPGPYNLERRTSYFYRLRQQGKRLIDISRCASTIFVLHHSEWGHDHLGLGG